MPPLKLHLAATPVHDLRSMASRLGVLARSLWRKAELIDAIVGRWEQPDTRHAVVSGLSPAAQGALAHLLRVERTPAALFFAEYGAIRHARTKTAGDSPWRVPLSVSEELYYAALLGAFDLSPLRITAYLCVPNDLELELRPYLSPIAAISEPLKGEASPDEDTPAWSTAYDVAQWLILLHEQSLVGNRVFSSAKTRWPPLNLMQRLNRRLAFPEREPLARAPSRRNRLRLILFLADVGQLHDQGAITSLGWTWLTEPPEQQTALLWRTWLDASPLVRQQYAFADALIPKPWPAPILHALKAMPHDVEPVELAEHMLQQKQTPAQFWTHQVHSLSDLRRLVSRMFRQVLLPFGIVAARRREHGVAYHLTFLGRHLLGTDKAQSVFSLPSISPSLQTVDLDRVWCVTVPPIFPFRTQADLAAYAVYTATANSHPHVVQHYQIDHASLARAISSGFQWPGLASVLESLALPLNSPECRQLVHCFTQIPTLALHTHTLLTGERRDGLRTLLEHAALRPLIDNLLSATTATLSVTPTEAIHRLQAAGYAVLADDVEDLPGSTKLPPSASLWLAGRLYRRLASFLSLPLPLRPSQLDALVADLSLIQRTTLSAFSEQIEAALLDLLDGRVFAPPTFTVDVAAHRLRLETAAAQRQPLYLDYFSPGRNLLTRRPIEPYWIEQAGQHLYVRAECLLTGRVLLFRLDRIHAIWDTPPDQPYIE